MTKIAGDVLPVDVANVDTDQIIPARFLTGVTRAGLGPHCFDGLPDADALLSAHAGATIVVARDNFGCGSSREHAVWALQERGFRAVVAPSFARIFEENAYANGLAPIAVAPDAIDAALACGRVEIDVDGERLHVPGAGAWTFALDPLRKHFLTSGGYLEFLAARIASVREWEARARSRAAAWHSGPGAKARMACL